MERASSKHGPRMDDALEHETHGLVQGGHATRAQEWHDPEPEGEDQHLEGRMRDVGTPPGIDQDQVERRSELARYLGHSVYPASAGELLEAAARDAAPEPVLDRLRALPSDRRYDNVADVTRALGMGVEERA